MAPSPCTSVDYTEARGVWTKKMCDLIMKNLFTVADEAEQTLFESAGAHLMQGRTPGEMAPGFYCSQTACPAQSFWEKFMAAD